MSVLQDLPVVKYVSKVPIQIKHKVLVHNVQKEAMQVEMEVDLVLLAFQDIIPVSMAVPIVLHATMDITLVEVVAHHVSLAVMEVTL